MWNLFSSTGLISDKQSYYIWSEATIWQFYASREDHWKDLAEARRWVHVTAQFLQIHIWRKLFQQHIIIFYCKHLFSHQRVNHTALRPHAVFFNTSEFPLCAWILTRESNTAQKCMRIMSQCVMPRSGVGVWCEELIGNDCNEVEALKQGQSAIIINVWHS